MKNIYVVSAIILAFFGCGGNKNDTTSMITADNGHHIRKRYNHNNVLISEEKGIKNDTGFILNGYCKDYFDNERIKTFGFYKNGLMDSIWRIYYENGQILQKMNFSNDSLIGPQYEYYNSGTIKFYHFLMTPCTPNEPMKYAFKLTLDSNKSVYSIEGRPLLVLFPDDQEIVSANAFDTVNLNYFFVETPENMTATVTLYSESKSGSRTIGPLLNFDVLPSIKLNNLTYRYPCSNGSTIIKSIYRLHYKDSNRIIVSDTTTCRINIKSN
jgi:hypothetical protein